MRTFAVLAITAMLVGCSGGSGPEQSPVTSGALPEGIATLYPNRDVAAKNWAQLPDSQRALLQDGELSFSDYEAAMLAFVACVEDAGLVFADGTPRYNEATRRFDVLIGPAPGTGDGSGGARQIDACAFEHLSTVQGLWNAQNRATEQELQQADAEWKQCLLASGEPADSVATLPRWGTSEWGEWYGAKLAEEAMNAGTEMPAWRSCNHFVGERFPSG